MLSMSWRSTENQSAMILIISELLFGAKTVGDC